MLSYVFLLTVGFVVSFFGSIPPGVINLTVMQLGIKNLLRQAYQFVFGVAFVEFFYALIAVRFSTYINNSQAISGYLNLLAALVLISFGVSNIVAARKNNAEPGNDLGKRGFFLKGALVSLLNPLAITFWLGITTYLLSSGIIIFQGIDYLAYLLGIVLGTIILLVLVAKMSRKFERLQGNKFIVYQLPALVFFAMGIYSFILWVSA